MASITINSAKAHARFHKVCEWEVARARIIGVLKDATPRTDDIKYPETFDLPDLCDRTLELIEELKRDGAQDYDDPYDYASDPVFVHK